MLFLELFWDLFEFENESIIFLQNNRNHPHKLNQCKKQDTSCMTAITDGIF